MDQVKETEAMVTATKKEVEKDKKKRMPFVKNYL